MMDNVNEPMSASSTDRRRLVQVVIGAGYAGLSAALAARRAAKTGGHKRNSELLLVNPTDKQTLVTQLYRVAAGTLPAAAAQIDLGPILAAYGIRLLTATVHEVDLEHRRIYFTDDRPPLTYDQLVLAAGSEPETFGIPGVMEYAIPLYGLVEAEKVATLVSQLQQDPTGPGLAIVGGGLAGVELAAELAEVLPAVPESSTGARLRPVTLVEATPQLLPGLPGKVSRLALKHLQERGIMVRLGSPVAQVTEDGLILRDGSSVPARATVWAAGVRGHSRWTPAAARDRRGRLLVNSFLQLQDHLEVFACGDIALATAQGQSQPDAPTAQNAILQGAAVGANLERLASGRPLVPYRARNLGLLLALGRHQAAAVFGSTVLAGRHWQWIKEAVEAHYVWSVAGLGALLLQRLAAGGPGPTLASPAIVTDHRAALKA